MSLSKRALLSAWAISASTAAPVGCGQDSKVLLAEWRPMQSTAATVAEDLYARAGDRRVKVVWQRTTDGQNYGIFEQDSGDHFALWGLDTSEGSERAICSQTGNYNKPLLTSDGDWIVYSDAVERKIRVVDWSCNNERLVASGFAGAIWRDPSTGIEWVYYQAGGNGYQVGTPLDLRRVNLNNTSQDELVWKKDATNQGVVTWWMGISADGTRIAGSFKNVTTGVILPTYDNNGGGQADFYESADVWCWTTMPPDNRYLLGVFDNPHTHWYVWEDPWDIRTTEKRRIDLSQAPGNEGSALYYPKHSNLAEFITLTSPISSDGVGDVYFGRLDSEFTQVTGWVRVTDTAAQEAWPDAWIDTGLVNDVSIDSFQVSPPIIAPGGSATLTWQTSNADTVQISPTVGSVSVDGSRSVSPTSNTTYTLTAIGAGGTQTDTVQLRVVAVTLPLAINSGDGSPAVASWEDEAPYRIGGSEYDFSSGSVTSPNGQSHVAPDDLYRTCVYQDHDYLFPVPNDTYTVRLHFFDDYAADGRAMSYSIEGDEKLSNFSIIDEAGGPNRVLVKSFEILVDDGNGLSIQARRGSGNDAFESGIEILKSSTVDDEPPTVQIDAPEDGSTLSGTVAIVGSASDNTGVDHVEVRVDGGAKVDATGTTDWTYAWVSGDVTDGGHTLTVTAWDAFGNSASDSVSVNVTNARSITITQPAGGEEWTAGETVSIEWTANNVTSVVIRLSSDGETWTDIAGRVDKGKSGWGHFLWTVPDQPSETCYVLIDDYFLGVPTESGQFSIVSGSSELPEPFEASGCSAGQGGAAAAWLGLVGLFVRRRRRLPGQKPHDQN